MKICPTCGLEKPDSFFRKGHRQCRDCRTVAQKLRYSSDRVCTSCGIFKSADQFTDGSHMCKRCKVLYEKNRLEKRRSDPEQNRKRLDQNNTLASKRYIERERKFGTLPMEDSYEEYLGIIGKNAKARAKDAEIPYDIDLDFLLNLFHQQGGRCALTGLLFMLQKNGTKRAFAPSIDRINCEGGYTKDNVRLVCSVVNIALNDFGDEVFDIMCRAYTDYQQRKM